MLRATFIAMSLVVIAASRVSTPAPQSTVNLAIEFEKTRFLQNERIFLWMVTTRAPGDERPIPASLLGTGRIIYTRPDGTTLVDPVSASPDGMGIHAPGDMGSRGGWTLRDDPPQLGRWSVVYEFAGRRSAPATFTIEAPEIFKHISAFVEFSTPRVYGAEAKATLVVLNGSPEVLRFVELGENHSMVWGRLHGGGIDSSFFVPPDVLETANGNKRLPMSVDRLDWDSLKRFPNVTVAPGETWRLSIPLSPWLGRQFGRTGGELSFSTEVQMLVGAPDGEWRGFSPVRLIASGATKVE